MLAHHQTSNLSQHIHKRPRHASSQAVRVRALHVDVAVVGGGPAGLASAASIRKADPSLKVHVFEKSDMKALGAAVMVGVNGLKAIEAIDPQLLSRLMDKAITLEGSDRYNMLTGEHLEYLPMRNLEFLEKYGHHNALFGWSDITACLAASLPGDSITSNCPITGFKHLPDGKLQLLGPGTGSETVTCTALIGADGWFSKIRQQVLQDGPPTFKNLVVFRARVKQPDWMTGQKYKTKWWVPPTGPSSSELMAVIIPVPGGDAVWQAHLPVSHMNEQGLAYDPVNGVVQSSGHADNTNTDPVDGGCCGCGACSAESKNTKQRCNKAISGFPQQFKQLVSKTPASAISEHGLYQRTADQMPEHQWGSGMVTLAGDAAHTAYVDGTGIGLSFEDAAVLGYQVQQLGLTEAALRSYEAERIPRVKAVFKLTEHQAASTAAGAPQRELIDVRADLLYGQAHFKPLRTLSAV